MNIVNLFCFILIVSCGFVSAQNIETVTPSDVNTKCPFLRQFNPQWKNEQSVTNILRLDHAYIVQKIVIDTTTCNADRELIEKNFTVKYQDSTDILKQIQSYSNELAGQWGQFDARIEILLDPVLFSDHVILMTATEIKCSSVTMMGCLTDDMCPIDHCKNNGLCVGNGKCACQKGFMGNHCEVPVSNMSVDDYEIIGAIPNLLITKDAAFDVIGDVTFSYTPPEDATLSKRHYQSHYSSSHFYGNGGSCTYSTSHSNGHSSSGHSTYGFQPSNSRCSSIFTSPSGYSYTSQMSFGHNHYHGGTSYLYSTHGSSHYSHGASMHYCNNELHMHVHISGQYPNEHYHVSAPFYPKPNVPYNFCSSYSPQYGATMYVNGRPLASQTKPSVIHPTTVSTEAPSATQQPLCYGSCGTQTGTGQHNYSISNIGICGGSVPFLAINNILGLLGTTMTNLLLHHDTTTTITVTKSTSAAMTTDSPRTIVTSLPPPSATSGHPSSVTSKYAPVCLDCTHVSSPGNCTSVMQCNHGDVCLILRDKYGYTQRCISAQDCDKGLSMTIVDCWECCSGNLCNDKCTSSMSTSVPSSCQDEAQCLSLKSLGAYYDVCQDPLYSTSVCKRSCGNCS